MSADEKTRPLSPGALAARRLGVLGGSFDPPHRCHLSVAERAAERFGLDHVVFVPAARPPHKPGRRLASGEDRVAMLELLLEDAHDGFGSVWTGELEREGPSYSMETVEVLAAMTDAELHWILGSDNLPGLRHWHRVEEFLRAVQPIVHFRRGEEFDLADLYSLSGEATARVEAGYLEVPPCDCSSTEIRDALAAGEDPGAGLTPRLARYVAARGLYQAE